MEDNGFEPFAPGCKPGVLAKYTNPPNKYNIDALLQGRLGLRLLCCSYRGAVIEALYTINGGGGWIRTTVLFTGKIYSLVQSTSLPRLQNCYTLPLRFLTRFKVAKENVYIKANCHHHHTSPFYRGHVCPVCFNMTNFFIYKKISHPRHRPFTPCL